WQPSSDSMEMSWRAGLAPVNLTAPVIVPAVAGSTWKYSTGLGGSGFLSAPPTATVPTLPCPPPHAAVSSAVAESRRLVGRRKRLPHLSEAGFIAGGRLEPADCLVRNV